MEEPINNNIESIPFQQNYINQNNLLNNDDLIKLRDEKIKELQRKIKGYEQMSHQQNIKSTIHDNLYVEYNSLNKNYAELEAELNSLKAENAKLQESLINKNNIICEYEKAIEATSN
jgi:DNA repair exonuclease SbcCD ATPase subunit